jgi:WD40 repeat protein
MPRIVVYRVADLSAVQVLDQGTEVQYSNLAFSGDSSLLASVGNAPDFTLAVWEWAEGQLLLRSKAFSQEVFTVQFNPFMAGRLTTSGIGHIRFWRMASTFTGMKLQGAIGKFGRVDLSDIVAYAELPDGKVLSGSETGELMLWEGNLIKCLIARPHAMSDEVGARLPAHDGPIHVVAFEAGPEGGAQGGHFITGGDDGVLRWWAFEDVDVADTEEDATHVLLDCVQEVAVSPGVTVHIHGLVHLQATKYAVLDGRGGVWTVDVSTGDNDKVLASHSGAVTSVVTAPKAQVCVTTGADGHVRAWDVPNRALLCSYSTPSLIPATCSTWAPEGVGGVLVGFADGVARLLVLDAANGSWLRRHVIKPHSQQVTHMAFSPDSAFLATCSVDGTVFLFSVPLSSASGAMAPLGFVRFPYAVGSVAWAPQRKGSTQLHLIVLPHASAELGAAELAVLPLPSDPGAFPDTSKTFELDLPYARYAVMLPNKAPPLKLAKPSSSSGNASEGKAGGGERNDDEEGGDDLDESLQLRPPGRLTAAAFAPWGPPVTQANAVSFTNSKRPFTSEWRVLVSCSGSLSQLLLEVALPQPSASVLAGGNTVTLLPASEHCRKGTVAEMCLVQPVASYAGSHAPATQIQALVVTPQGHSSAALLLTYGLDGAVTLRSCDHPHVYARADCGSAQPVAGFVHQAAAATFDGAFVCVPTAHGAIISVRSNVPALIAASAEASSDAALASRHGFVPHPHPHDAPEVLLPKGGAEGILAALREQREGDGAGPNALPVSSVQPGAPPKGGQVMANAAVFTASRGEHAVAVEVVTNPPPLPLTEEELAEMRELASTAGAPPTPAPQPPPGPQLDPAALIGAPPPGAGRMHALHSDSKAGEDSAFPPVAAGEEDDSRSVASSLEGKEPEDITAPEAYSIQQSKLQSEEDQHRAAAEHTKDQVRDAIRDMQLKFAALRCRMGVHVTRAALGIPEGPQGDAQWSTVQTAAAADMLPQLSDSELVIDAEMQLRLSQESAGMTQEVERQLAYAGEQGRLAVAKLRKAFLDPLAVEDFSVRGLNDRGIVVRSFATRHLDKALLGDVEHLRGLLQDGAAAAAAEGGGRGATLSDAAAFRRQLDSAEEPLALSMGPDASISGSSFDVRKARRLARNAALQRIQDARPGAGDANPELVLALEDAERNWGDFPLKSDPHYEVPEHKRLDDHKKAQQITLLQAALFTVRMLFNHRLLSLRQLKAQLISAVHASNARVMELSRGLGDESSIISSLWSPPSDPYADGSEWPELRELRVAHEVRVSASMPTNSGRAVSAQAPPTRVAGAQLPQRALHASSRARMRGANVPAWAADNPVIASAMSGARAARGMPALPSTVAGASQPAAHLRTPQTPLNGAYVPVAIDQSEARSGAMRRRWTASRRRIVRNISAAVKGFDDALAQLARERLGVASDLKAGEVRFLVLAHELALLQDMAKRDRTLSSKLSKALGEKASIEAALAECGAAIDEKLGQQSAWESRDAAIAEQFDEMVPDTHPAHSELLRVLRRKVKRHKEDGAGDEEDSDEESELNFDSDEDEEDDGGDDVCPEGCEQALFDRVLDLREERLDLEEVQTVLAESRGAIDKAHARHKARQAQVNGELGGIRKEMQAFQSEKQGVLNKLTITVPLHFSQIYLGKQGVKDVNDDADGNAHPTPSASGVSADAGASIGHVLQLHQSAEASDRRPQGQMPATLQGSLLFNRDKLHGLRTRVGDLKSEIVSLRDGFKDLRSSKRRLGRQQGEAETGIAAVKAKAEGLQVLKFGQMVDIRTLDKATGSSALNRAEAEVGSQEDGQRGDVNKVQMGIMAQQAALVEVTRSNTKLLEAIAGLTGKQNSLEGELDDTSTASALLSPRSGASHEAAAEKVRLQQLVQLQVAEMEALRGEVFVLRHKGGYLYAPPSANAHSRTGGAREGLAQGSAAAAIHAARSSASGLLPAQAEDSFLGEVLGNAHEGKK